jgi:hypothetical protein
MIHETVAKDGKVHLRFSAQDKDGRTIPLSLDLLRHMSIDQVEDVWADLLRAFNGKNGYGTVVAEIYAYRLQPYSPALVHQGTSLCEQAEMECAHEAARNLHDIIKAFRIVHPCRVWIETATPEWGDGSWSTRTEFKPFGPWVKDIVFCHREHVKVEKV